MPSCPHVQGQPPGLYDAVAEARTRGCIRGCNTKQLVGPNVVLVCLQPGCGAALCGSSVRNHAEKHFSSKGHPAFLDAHSGEVTCVECGLQVGGKAAEELSAVVAAFPRRVDGGGGLTAAGVGDGPITPRAPVTGEAGTDALAPLQRRYPPSGGLTGLQNLGNTCYFNSALQALSHVPQLALFATEVPPVSTQTTRGCTAAHFITLMQNAWVKEHEALAPDAVVTPGRRGVSAPVLNPRRVLDAAREVNPMFEGYMQHDAHEMLRTLLNDMHEKLAVDMPVNLFSGPAATAMASASSASSGDGAAGGDDSDATGPHAHRGAAGAVGPGSRGAASSSRVAAVIPGGEAAAPGAGRVRRVASSTAAGGAPPGGSPSAPPGEAVDSDEDVPPPSTATSPPQRPGRQWLHDGPYTGPETVQRSIMTDLFGGVYCSQVRCRTCHTISCTYDTFYDLSLPIPKKQHPVARGSDGTAARTPAAEAAAWLRSGPREEGMSLWAGVPSGDAAFTAVSLGSSGGGSSDDAFAAGTVNVTVGGGSALAAPSSGPVSARGGGAAAPVPQPPASSSSSRSSRSGGGGLFSGFKSLMGSMFGSGGGGHGHSAGGSSGKGSGTAAAAAAAPVPGAAAAPSAAADAKGETEGAVLTEGSGESAVAEQAPAPAPTPTASSGGGGLLSFMSGPSIGLGDCLFQFCEWEPLEGSDRYACETCGTKRDADKRITIAALPEVLCIHLKRFSYQGWGSKNSATVDFPLEGLDLSPFVVPFGPGAAAQLYVRAKEQQAERSLARVKLLQPAVLAEVGSRGGMGPLLAPNRVPLLGAGAVVSLRTLSASPQPQPPGSARSLGAPKTARRAGSDEPEALGGEGGSGGASASSSGDAAAAADGASTTSGSSSTLLSSSSSRRLLRKKKDKSGEVPQLRLGGAGGEVPGTGAGKGSADGTPAGTPRRDVVHEMNPEVRGLLLHRNSVAMGTTGTEAVAAAAALLAATEAGAGGAAPGSGALLSCPPPDFVALPPTVQAELLRALDVPAASVWGGGAPPQTGVGVLGGPTPVPAGRRVHPARMGGASYDLVSIVQHMGGLGGGHYIAHGRHRGDGRWYTFDDSRVSNLETSKVPKVEGYVLFYMRSRGGAEAPPRVPVPPADGQPGTVHVSKYWWLRYRLMAAPGPITNADILCDHGAVKAVALERIDDAVVTLTEPQYAELAASYGAAEPPLRCLAPCPECKAEAAALAKRRQREKDRILAVDTKTQDPGCAWYIMSEVWLAKWRGFIDDKGPQTDGTGRGVLPPGPIDNARLLNKSGAPLPNLRAGIHYRGVNKSVWDFLHGIYGGGPQLLRPEIDIYKPEYTAPAPTPAAAAAGEA